VAAGPLEDLLVRHGSAFISRVKEEVPHNERLLYALFHVIVGGENEPTHSEIESLTRRSSVSENNLLREMS
jgi:hypothetical protein